MLRFLKSLGNLVLTQLIVLLIVYLNNPELFKTHIKSISLAIETLGKFLKEKYVPSPIAH